MALQLFMNDLILSQGGISFDIVVVDDNAKSLEQPKDSFAYKQLHESIKNRWGSVVRQESDPCIVSPKINVDYSSSSKSAAPVERRPLSKTKSDSTLAIPQRVASPSALQANRKRIRAQIKIVEDTSNSSSSSCSQRRALSKTKSDNTLAIPQRVASPSALQANSKRIRAQLKMVEDTSNSSSSSCSQAPPQLPLRVESPHALKDRKHISVVNKENRSRKSRSRAVTVPALKLSTPKPQSHAASIAIIDEVFLMMEEGPSPISKGFKQDRYTKHSRRTQKGLPSRLLGLPYNTTIQKRLPSSQ